MKIASYIASVLVLAFALWAGYQDRVAVMSVAAVFFFGVLFFANIDRISSFKAGAKGFEAETREIVKEAKDVTRELRRLAVILVENQLTSIQRVMRLGGYTDADKEARKAALVDILKDLEIPDEEIQRALKEWNELIIFDYAHHLLGGGYRPSNLSEEAMADWEVLRKGKLYDMPRPSQIRDFVTKHGLITPEIDERIEDYAYFLEHKRIRRPEDFALRDKWKLTD